MKLSQPTDSKWNESILFPQRQLLGHGVSANESFWLEFLCVFPIGWILHYVSCHTIHNRTLGNGISCGIKKYVFLVALILKKNPPPKSLTSDYRWAV